MEKGSFVSLVNKLQKSPNDYSLKMQVMEYLPTMITLGRTNPFVLYLFAKSLLPTSPKYRDKMRESANKGCTNAMLDYSKLLIESGKPCDLKTVKHFVKQIKASKDTYIKELCKDFVSKHPQLSFVFNEQTCKATNRSQFFQSDLKKEEMVGHAIPSCQPR